MQIRIVIWGEIFAVPTAAARFHSTFCKPPQVSVAKQNSTQWAAQSKIVVQREHIFHRCALAVKVWALVRLNAFDSTYRHKVGSA